MSEPPDNTGMWEACHSNKLGYAVWLKKSTNAVGYENIIEPHPGKFTPKFCPVKGEKAQRTLPGKSSTTARAAALRLAEYYAAPYPLPEKQVRMPRGPPRRRQPVQELLHPEIEAMLACEPDNRMRTKVSKVCRKMANLKGKGTAAATININFQWPSMEKIHKEEMAREEVARLPVCWVTQPLQPQPRTEPLPARYPPGTTQAVLALVEQIKVDARARQAALYHAEPGC